MCNKIVSLYCIFLLITLKPLLSSSLLSKNLKIKIYRTIILPVVLYGCETWLLTLRGERSRYVGGQSKTQLVSYIKDVYSKIRSKTCFGLIWPSSGFSFSLKFRYINCDVEISHPIIILVCLCIGGYYITLIYIYIYSLSVGRGGVSSWRCQLDANLLFYRGLLSRGCR